MDFRSYSSGAVNILAISGRFDAYNASKIREWLLDATKEKPAWIVVNLKQVTFLDSTALSTLVQAMKRSRELGGDLRLCSLTQPVRMIFELTRLDKAFEIFLDEDGAVQAFTSS